MKGKYAVPPSTGVFRVIRFHGDRLLCLVRSRRRAECTAGRDACETTFLSAAVAYVIDERGPEQFVPESDVTVIPAATPALSTEETL